jgi:deoxyribodipyrimidine photolyase-like uncharacterized protein
MLTLLVDPRDIFEWMNAVFADSLDSVMIFNVFAMGYFDRRFTHKQYVFSSQYAYSQSGGRLPRDDFVDDIYRRFVSIYRSQLKRAPRTKPFQP